MDVRIFGGALSFKVLVVCAFAVPVGCSANERTPLDGDGANTDPKPSFSKDGGVEGGSQSPCQINRGGGDPEGDPDGDGYPMKVDCNECDPNVNAGAFDVPGNGVDEDCNGTADDESANCDRELALEATDPFDGAKAIGLCKKATNDRMWGVVEAKWITPDGSPQEDPIGEGILTKLGVNTPRNGSSFLALSSGTARAPGHADYKNVHGWRKAYTHGAPAGYPKKASSCASIEDPFGPFNGFRDANDGAALFVKIRVPSNAKSFAYQQNFFTYEFPEYTCHVYNDFFVALMTPKLPSLPDGNIAFDQDGNSISVNNSMLQVCTPQSAGGKAFSCPLGPDLLSGTGFETRAATGWLTTTAPVESQRGKEITLMWAIWDQYDGAYDSTVLIDDFRWSVQAASKAETKPTPPK